MTKALTPSKFILAASTGDLKFLRKAIGDQSVSVNAIAGAGNATALHAAAAAGKNAVIKLLVQSGAEVHQEDGAGRVPLAVAAKPVTVRCLCELGADPNFLNSLGIPPIAYQFDASVVKALLTAGAEIDATWNWVFEKAGLRYTNLTKSAQVVAMSIPVIGSFADQQCKSTADGMKLLKALLSLGADPNHQFTVQQGTGKKRKRRLLEAVSEVGAIEMLLSHGAELGKCWEGGELVRANLLMGQPKSEKILRKFDLFRPKSNELVLAIAKGSESKVRSLVDSGVDIDYLGYGKVAGVRDALHLPLALACKTNQHEMVELLLSLGANPNKFDPFGYAPIHSILDRYWDYKQPTSLLRLLLEWDADPNLIVRAKSEHPRELLLFDKEDESIRKLLAEFGCILDPYGPPDDSMYHIGQIIPVSAGCDDEGDDVLSFSTEEKKLLKKHLGKLEQVKSTPIMNPFLNRPALFEAKSLRGAKIYQLKSRKKPQGSFVVSNSLVSVYGRSKKVRDLALKLAKALGTKLRNPDS